MGLRMAASDYLESIEENPYDSESYQIALGLMETAVDIEELISIRECYMANHVADASFVDSWLSEVIEDNTLEFVSQNLITACDDAYNVNCWLKLFHYLESISASPEFIKPFYSIAYESVGHDLTCGHLIGLKYLGFLKRKMPGSEDEKNVAKFLCTKPFLSLRDYYSKILKDYKIDDESVKTALEHVPYIKKFEANFEKSTNDYINFLAENGYCRDFAAGVYRRILRANPKDDLTWSKYLFYYGCSVTAYSRYRRANPLNPNGWITEALSYRNIDRAYERISEIFDKAFECFDYNCPEGKKDLMIGFASALALTAKGDEEKEHFAAPLMANIRYIPNSNDEIQIRVHIAKLYESLNLTEKANEFWLYIVGQKNCLNADILTDYVRFISKAYPEKVLDVIKFALEQIHAPAPKIYEIFDLIQSFEAADKSSRRCFFHYRFLVNIHKMTSGKLPVLHTTDFDRQQQSNDNSQNRTVFLKNVDFKVTESSIYNVFSSLAGPIKNVNLFRNANGRSKGMCTIEFETVKSFEIALSLNNHVIKGRPIKISPYRDPNQIDQSMANLKIY